MEIRFSLTEKDYENTALSLELVVPRQWRVWDIFQWCMSFIPWEVPRLRRKKHFRTSPFTAAERILTIDDRGVSAVLHNCMFRYEWEAFTRYRETQFTFLLLTSSYDGFAWIPKRVMSPPQIEELRQQLKARLLAC